MSDPVDTMLRELARAPAISPRDPRLGTRLGPYRLDARIGSGATGVVYRARDERLARDVAIKVLKECDGSYERLLAEARSAAAVQHPNVAAIHDVGEDGGVAFIAMELALGDRLLVHAERGLSWRDAMKLGGQIAAGLARAHAAGLVHGDLKPDNVVVTEDGCVKILDFGIASRSGETLRGGRGARGYAAPEAWRGETIDARADVYAWGRVMESMLRGPVPSALAKLIARCVADDRDARPADAGVIADALAPIGTRRRWPFALILVFALLPAIAIAWTSHAVRSDDPRWRRLTQNAAEAPISAAALSPDGERLAYAEARGLFELDIESGRVRTVRLAPPDDYRCVSFFPDGQRVLASGARGVFIVSRRGHATAIGEAREACAAVIDSHTIALSDEDGVIVRDLARGTERRVWRRSGERRLFSFAVSESRAAIIEGDATLDASLVSVDLADGRRRVVRRDRRLAHTLGTAAVAFAPDGTLLLAAAPTASAPGELVAIDIASGSTSTIARLPDEGAVASLSVARTGRLAVLRMDRRAHTYIAPLGARLGEPRRISLWDRDERPSSFSARGDRLFTVAEAGRTHSCGRIALADGVGAELFGARPCTWPVSAPDGSMYWWSIEARAQVLHRGDALVHRFQADSPPLAGGRAQPWDRAVLCARDRCFIADRAAGELYELHGNELVPAAELERDELMRGVAISEDGSRFARVDGRGRLRVMELGRDADRRIEIPGCQFQYLAADGPAWIATAMCERAPAYRILRASEDGSIEELWSSTYAWVAHPVRSPDGTALAFARIDFDTDVFVRDP